MRDINKQGKVYKYKDLIYWAQGGVICIEDTRDGSFVTVPVEEFIQRILNVRLILQGSKHKYADERNEDFNFIMNGAACVKEARRQGDPFDPAVVAQLNLHRKKSYIFNGAGQAISVSNAVHHGDVPEGKLLPPIPTAPESKPRQIITEN